MTINYEEKLEAKIDDLSKQFADMRVEIAKISTKTESRNDAWKFLLTILGSSLLPNAYLFLHVAGLVK